MSILKTIAGLATSAFMATTTMAQELNLEPYRCPETSSNGITEIWMESESR